MFKYILKHKLYFLITVITRLIGATMQVFIAIIIKRLVDSAANRDMNNFVKIILFCSIYFIVLGIINYLTGLTQAIYVKKTLMKLKEDIFKGILAKDYRTFNTINTADYISNLTNDVNLIETKYIVPFLMMTGDILIFIVTTAVLLYMNGWITLTLFITAAVLLVVPYFLGKPTEVRQNKVSNNLAVFTTKIKDIFLGYEVIKSFNIEESVTKEFKSQNDIVESSKFKTAHIKAISDSISLILAIVCQLSGIAVAGYFVITGNFTVGTLIAVVQLANGIQGPVMWIIEKVTMIKGMSSINKKIIDIIKYGEIEQKGKDIKAFNNSIILKDVCFSYNDKNTVINNFSYRFNKSKKYAIVGESGCGKSTLLKLILGYYDNYKGNISIDGQEVKNLNMVSVNRLISMIHQNVYMFDKSIKDNILLSKCFNQKTIENTLKISGVSNFLEELTKGVDSLVGENGNSLSGGQRQRIAIARALIQNTPILMLDEGTSALDMQTAYDIESTLLKIENLTVITITHKLLDVLLEKYDAIIVMKKGKIVEVDNFNTLMSNKGTFYNLYNIQKKKEVYCKDEFR